MPTIPSILGNMGEPLDPGADNTMNEEDVSASVEDDIDGARGGEHTNSEETQAGGRIRDDGGLHEVHDFILYCAESLT